MRGANFQDADLRQANLQKADLGRANFQDADLGHASLQKTNLHEANFKGAILAGANLKGADLVYANLHAAYLRSANLQEADLVNANLQEAKVMQANLQGANLGQADLQKAKFLQVNLQKAKLLKANLRSAQFALAHLDGMTTITKCKFDEDTDFSGVGLDAATIDPGLKAALKNNIRRIQWQNWIKNERGAGRNIMPLLVESFWWLSDYGRSTKRIIKAFFWLVLAFAVVYWIIAMIPGSQSIIHELRQVEGQKFGCIHTLFRSTYFSIVTMTTLGFGDMHAAKTGSWPSYLGYLFLSAQVIMGYVILGALVTRLGVLFTGEAPAAEPTPIKFQDNKND